MEFLSETVEKVNQHPLLTIQLNTELVDTSGFKGAFTSKLRTGEGLTQVQHGVGIIATGGVEYRGNEYGYGQDPNILTQLEFEDFLGDFETGITAAQIPESVVMIQCVGPAEKYCSRLCCTTAMKNALKLKELNPKAEISIIFRDIRTYGFKERLYTEARRAGVRFIQYKFEQKPEVLAGTNELIKNRLTVRVNDPMLGRELQLTPDLVVLSMPVIPSAGAEDLPAV